MNITASYSFGSFLLSIVFVSTVWGGNVPAEVDPTNFVGTYQISPANAQGAGDTIGWITYEEGRDVIIMTYSGRLLEGHYAISTRNGMHLLATVHSKGHNERWSIQSIDQIEDFNNFTATLMIVNLDNGTQIDYHGANFLKIPLI